MNLLLVNTVKTNIYFPLFYKSQLYFLLRCLFKLTVFKFVINLFDEESTPRYENEKTPFACNSLLNVIASVQYQNFYVQLKKPFFAWEKLFGLCKLVKIWIITPIFYIEKHQRLFNNALKYYHLINE